MSKGDISRQFFGGSNPFLLWPQSWVYKWFLVWQGGSDPPARFCVLALSMDPHQNSRVCIRLSILASRLDFAFMDVPTFVDPYRKSSSIGQVIRETKSCPFWTSHYIMCLELLDTCMSWNLWLCVIPNRGNDGFQDVWASNSLRHRVTWPKTCDMVTMWPKSVYTSLEKAFQRLSNSVSFALIVSILTEI